MIWVRNSWLFKPGLTSLSCVNYSGCYGRRIKSVSSEVPTLLQALAPHVSAGGLIPSIGGFIEYAEAGGSMSYAPSIIDNFGLAAAYVEKILKDEKPGEQPMDQPTRFHLTVNLKTAKALRLTIPKAILLSADQVIE